MMRNRRSMRSLKKQRDSWKVKNWIRWLNLAKQMRSRYDNSYTYAFIYMSKSLLLLDECWTTSYLMHSYFCCIKVNQSWRLMFHVTRVISMMSPSYTNITISWQFKFLDRHDLGYNSTSAAAVESRTSAHFFLLHFCLWFYYKYLCKKRLVIKYFTYIYKINCYRLETAMMKMNSSMQKMLKCLDRSLRLNRELLWGTWGSERTLLR